MKQILLSKLLLLIFICPSFGSVWELINEKSWIANNKFPTKQYVFFETKNGLKKAVFQIGGSGVCATHSLIYDIVIKEDTIYLKNELDLEKSSPNNENQFDSFKTLYLNSDTTIISKKSSIEYRKKNDDPVICNWIETYSGKEAIPIEELKKISLDEKQIYDTFSFNLGPDPKDCGIDDSSKLSDKEAIFLNEYLKSAVNFKEFDFNSKNVLFITGNRGRTLGSKIDYFDDVRKWKENSNSHIATSLHVLSEKEKIKYGFDAILTYWVKVFPLKTKKILRKTKSK